MASRKVVHYLLMVLLPVVVASCDMFAPGEGCAGTVGSHLEVWEMMLDGSDRELMIDNLKFNGSEPHPDDVEFAGVSPGGSVLYFVHQDFEDSTANLQARHVPSGNAVALDFRPTDTKFALSPDGSRFIFHRRLDGLWIANRDGSEARQIADIRTVGPSAIWVDNSHVAYALYREGIHTLSLGDQSEMQISEVSNVHSFDVSTDLATVAYMKLDTPSEPSDPGVFVEDSSGIHRVDEKPGSGLRRVIHFTNEDLRLIYLNNRAKALVRTDQQGVYDLVVTRTSRDFRDIIMGPAGERALLMGWDVLQLLAPLTGSLSTIQNAEDLVGEESFEVSIRASFRSAIFRPDKDAAYALVEKRRLEFSCSE